MTWYSSVLEKNEKRVLHDKCLYVQLQKYEMMVFFGYLKDTFSNFTSPFTVLSPPVRSAIKSSKSLCCSLFLVGVVYCWEASKYVNILAKQTPARERSTWTFKISERGEKSRLSCITKVMTEGRVSRPWKTLIAPT